jgi:hypothetical protein
LLYSPLCLGFLIFGKKIKICYSDKWFYWIT